MRLSLGTHTVWLPGVTTSSGAHLVEKTELESASMKRHLWWELLLLQELHSGPGRNLQEQAWGGRLLRFCTQGRDPLLLSTTHPALSFSAGSVSGEKNIFLTCKPHFGKPSRALSTPCFLQAQLNFVLTRAGY